jgi:hypothetical protein
MLHTACEPKFAGQEATAERGVSRSGSGSPSNSNNTSGGGGGALQLPPTLSPPAPAAQQHQQQEAVARENSSGAHRGSLQQAIGGALHGEGQNSSGVDATCLANAQG